MTQLVSFTVHVNFLTLSNPWKTDVRSIPSLFHWFRKILGNHKINLEESILTYIAQYGSALASACYSRIIMLAVLSKHKNMEVRQNLIAGLTFTSMIKWFSEVYGLSFSFHQRYKRVRWFCSRVVQFRILGLYLYMILLYWTSCKCFAERFLWKSFINYAFVWSQLWIIFIKILMEICCSKTI